MIIRQLRNSVDDDMVSEVTFFENLKTERPELFLVYKKFANLKRLDHFHDVVSMITIRYNIQHSYQRITDIYV